MSLLATLTDVEMLHFIDVTPAYAHDALPAYVAYEDDGASTLVGTEPRASADDYSGVNDDAGGRCDTPRVPYSRRKHQPHARLRVDRRMPQQQRSDRLYAAADDFDVRGLYAAADTFDIRAGDRLYAPAEAMGTRATIGDCGGSASPTASTSPSAPAGIFACLKRVLRSIGRCLRRFLPNRGTSADERTSRSSRHSLVSGTSEQHSSELRDGLVLQRDGHGRVDEWTSHSSCHSFVPPTNERRSSEPRDELTSADEWTSHSSRRSFVPPATRSSTSADERTRTSGSSRHSFVPPTNEWQLVRAVGRAERAARPAPRSSVGRTSGSSDELWDERDERTRKSARPLVERLPPRSRHPSPVRVPRPSFDAPPPPPPVPVPVLRPRPRPHPPSLPSPALIRPAPPSPPLVRRPHPPSLDAPTFSVPVPVPVPVPTRPRSSTPLGPPPLYTPGTPPPAYSTGPPPPYVAHGPAANTGGTHGSSGAGAGGRTGAIASVQGGIKRVFRNVRRKIARFFRN
ncbi:hypothetical protein B0H15DRAFT_947924 [Mycena belliarum]|uniref:Uncharacterized protein n=1 Tax=Mycena belliarum TaxID=1033014 RepID=A0AAD6U9H1_9AGAR|nr:hypothetical protein B0H15DRAFT_947924 [Mycena belliae]